MKKEIDRMLKEWGRQNRASPEHLDRLAADISAEVSSAGCSSAFERRTRLFHKLAYFAAGAAAMLLILAAGQYLLDKESINGSVERPAAFASIRPEEIDNSRIVFQEMEKLFPKQLRWIAESNGKMAMGVESIANGDEDAVPMLLRLTVVSRDLDKDSWVPAWGTDILMRGEEMVEIRPDEQSENRLALWVYPLVDGKLAVDAELALKAPVDIVSRINRIMGPGETAEVACARTEGKEYRIYQTVEML